MHITSPSWITASSWWRGLPTSVKLWAVPCRGTRIDRSYWRDLTKRGPLEKAMASHFSVLASRTPWTVWKGKKIGHRRWAAQVGKCSVCYWEEWRAITTNSSRKNEADGPRGNDAYSWMCRGGKSKVWFCKEQYCIGIWNVRSMNQGKLEVVR